MATRIDSYDFSPYPYSEWFDGNIWRLKGGADFKVKASTMAAYIRKEARDRHVSVEVKAEPNGDVVMKSGRSVRAISATS
ncbi:MAG: hypothetical protein J2P16_08745 [Mycobacterium sp.]|nr:hypothetical protein [Mycobacterium sp.]